MCLDIRGPGSSVQELSHSSVLFIHRIAFTSSLLELHFENVQLQVKHDWSLIVDVLSDSRLITFELCPSSLLQSLMAVDTEKSIFMRTVKVNWASFTLDVAPMSEDDLLRIRDVFMRSTVDLLRLLCIPFDPRLSDSIARVLRCIPWTSLKSLVLTGSNIDAWMLLLTNNVTPRLNHLSIIGDGPELQQLSPSSVLSTCRMVGAGFLNGLHFVNVQLQDKRDWDLVTDSLGPLFKQRMKLCANTRKQLLSTKAAIAIDLNTQKFEKLRSEGETANGSILAGSVKEILNRIFACVRR